MHCRPRGPFPDKSSQPGGRPDRDNIDIRGPGGVVIKVCSFVPQLFGLPVSSCYGCELLSVTCLSFDLALLFLLVSPPAGGHGAPNRELVPLIESSSLCGGGRRESGGGLQSTESVGGEFVVPVVVPGA